MKTNKKGFTIVELVIVIAVIAILAAVLIPTFSGIINRANESVAFQETRNTLTEYIGQNGDAKDGLMFYYPNEVESGSKYNVFLYATGKLYEVGVLTYNGTAYTWTYAEGYSAITFNSTDSKFEYNGLIIGSYTYTGDASFSEPTAASATVVGGYGPAYISKNAQVSKYSTSAYITLSYNIADGIAVTGNPVSQDRSQNLVITVTSGTATHCQVGSVSETDDNITISGNTITINKALFSDKTVTSLTITIS